MELLPLMSAYLVCSAGLGIAAGKLITRRRELTVKAPAPNEGSRPGAHRAQPSVRVASISSHT
jgi:hypothetical protein